MGMGALAGERSGVVFDVARFCRNSLGVYGCGSEQPLGQRYADRGASLGVDFFGNSELGRVEN